MAVVALAAISAVMNLIYADMMADQIRRDVLLPNLLAVKTGRNDTCTWPVKVSGRAAGGAYAEGADMIDDDFDAHTRLQASLAWAQYRTGAKVTGLAEALSRLNGSIALDAGLFQDEVRDGIDFLSIKVAAHTYAGNVGNSPVEIEGLARAIDSSTTYATIVPGTHPEWAAAENTMALADLSFETLRENLIRPFVDACGMYPRFVTVPGNIFDAIGALFGDQRQFVDTVMGLGGEAVNIKLRGGFRAIEIDGVVYVEDRHATSNTAYAFGPDAAEYVQVPAVGPEQAGTIIQAVKDLTGVTLQPDEVRAMLVSQTQRIQPTIELLGKTGDNIKAQIKCYLQLRVRHRNRTAKLLFT